MKKIVSFASAAVIIFISFFLTFCEKEYEITPAIQPKNPAIAKLTALGLSADEIAALGV